MKSSSLEDAGGRGLTCGGILPLLVLGGPLPSGEQQHSEEVFHLLAAHPWPSKLLLLSASVLSSVKWGTTVVSTGSFARLRKQAPKHAEYSAGIRNKRLTSAVALLCVKLNCLQQLVEELVPSTCQL